MKVLNNNLNEVYKVIESKAKFQKVMLMFDDTTSELEILETYNAIKEICIFNKMHVNALDLNEINNGYRAVIYLCDAKSFLKLNFDKSDFVNLSIVKGKDVLPFCVNSNAKLLKKDNYIFINNTCFDVELYPSVVFNKFFNYLEGVVFLNDKKYECFDVENDYKDVNIYDCLKSVDENLIFEDLMVLAKTNLDYKHLGIIHLVLLNAFALLLKSIKNKSLMLVDVYKICKDDYRLLDKLYVMFNNEIFHTMINLNYNFLVNLCLKTKEEILSKLIGCDLENDEIEKVLIELKEYAKESKGVIGYLYLYDFFKV